jgi:hypothetical protein
MHLKLFFKCLPLSLSLFPKCINSQLHICAYTLTAPFQTPPHFSLHARFSHVCETLMSTPSPCLFPFPVALALRRDPDVAVTTPFLLRQRVYDFLNIQYYPSPSTEASSISASLLPSVELPLHTSSLSFRLQPISPFPRPLRRYSILLAAGVAPSNDGPI